MKINTCPFCNSNNIKYSIKIAGHFECYYQAAMYCADCNSYGPRVISSKARHDDYQALRTLKNNPDLMNKAIMLWNERKQK